MAKSVTQRNVHVTLKCRICGKDFTGVAQRSQFCSAACKLKNYRYKRQGLDVTSNVTFTSVQVSENTGKHQDNSNVTHTDQDLINDAAKRGLIDWYNFSKHLHDRKCRWCGELFQTRLELNYYCGARCRDSNLTSYNKKIA
jgi:endogenous inhibitor of DNA gyrase (YacG/DUF329 family)